MVIWVVSAAETKTYPHHGALDEFLSVNFDEIVVNGKLVGEDGMMDFRAVELIF